MATENAKILLRRGFRHELSSDTLDTGEMGFTTDTNQLFVGIDSAINEIQFDPFVNAHAIIQSWLDGDDCPVPGLKVDEDLVIRNIPTSIDSNGDPVSSIQVLLDAMHFFVQNINLVGDFDVDVGDTLYQRNFVYANNETPANSILANRTYRILDISAESQNFINDAVGTTDVVYSMHDKFTVRVDYTVNPNQWTADEDKLSLVEIVDITLHTSGIVSQVYPYDETTNSKLVSVTVREAHGEFLLDNPYTNNYYHFNGDRNGELKSDFGLFMYTDGEWIKQDVYIVDEANHLNDIETVVIEGVELDKPIDALLTDTTVLDHVVVTKSSKVVYWKKNNDVWKLIGSDEYVSGLADMVVNSDVHHIPSEIVELYESKPGGRWEVVHTQNKGFDNESVSVLTDVEFWLWYQLDETFTKDFVHGDIYIPGTEGDNEEDEIEIRYYYNDDFQFSDKPPVTFSTETETFTPPAKRKDGSSLINGDYYVYTDKDIFGGTNLNIFQWNSVEQMHVHNTVPVFENDDDANQNATAGVLIYAMPFLFDGKSYAVLELRERKYDTSTVWSEYTYDGTPRYYFSTNNDPDVTESDITYAYTIDDKSDFAAGFLGRARRNVEVITENSFNQLFADQHLTAQDTYSGMRPSLFKKTFEDTDGVFLKFDKNVCTTFFIDYSLKQVVGDVVFLRVGQLKVINGYPLGFPEIKLTDENTEIWHKGLDDETDSSFTIADHDEFSNIVFEAAIEVDNQNFEIANELENMLIIYRQSPGSTTEVSYTIKRWTM